MSCCHLLPPFVQLGSARKAGNNAKEQKNALDAAQSQSESTSLASCRHPPLPRNPLAGESKAAAKRIVLQITAGCAGGWAAGRTRPTVQCGGSSNDGGGVRRQTSFEWKCV